MFEGGLFSKLFKGYIICFLGHLFGGKIFEQYDRETNLKKTRSVELKRSVRRNFLYAAPPPERAMTD